MGVIQNGSFFSSYYGDQIDALLAAMAQANPMPSGTDWVAFIDDCREAQSTAESAATSAGNSATSAASSASTASTKATQASSSASSAASNATLSQSWAVGGTGTRTGEDTNNARYWSQQAQHAAGGGVTSFNNRSGVVLPQSGDYSVGMVTDALSVVGKGKQLLDNAYFIGGGSQQGSGQLPINQRGQTSYSSVGYGIDRWYNSGAQTSTEITANGLRVYRTQGSASTSSKNAVQYVSGLERFIGQKVTISALVYSSTDYVAALAFNGVVSSSTALGSASATNVQTPTLISKTITLPNNFTGTIAFALRSTGGDYEATFMAAKLEFGDQQTLARNVGTAANPRWVLNDLSPDYQTELKKCQLYQQIIRNADANAPRCVAMGMTTTNSGTTVFPLNLSPMRVNAFDSSTITISGATVSERGPLYADNGNGTVKTLSADNMSVNFCPDSGFAELRVSGLTDFARGTPLTLWLNAGASITLDANI